jgi:hypothetical protein
MFLQNSPTPTRSVPNIIRVGVLAAAFCAEILFPAQAVEVTETTRRVDLRASLLHAGSASTDVERMLGRPTGATDLGEPDSGDWALVYTNEPLRTRVVLTAGRITAIALDVAYVDPTPLPARARVIKATMTRQGVRGLLGTPDGDRQWMEAARNIEQMVFAQNGEPEFSVFLSDGLVVNVTPGRETPPGITSMLLPTAVPDASVGGQLAIGLSQTQVASLLGPAESTTQFTFKGEPVEYAIYHLRDRNTCVTVTFMGGVLTAFTYWTPDEL